MIDLDSKGFSQLSGTLKVMDSDDYQYQLDVVNSESDYNKNEVEGVIFRDSILLTIKNNGMSCRNTMHVKLDIDALNDLLSYGEMYLKTQ